MRRYIVFLLLLTVKMISRVLFRVRLSWLHDEHDPWANLRVLAVLNHTSLFEPIFVAAAPNRLLWQIATHGVIPVADKTARRPLVGQFFRLVAHDVVPITRERDDTWALFLSRVQDPHTLIVILPEGRMKRPGGRDAHGNPMTVRGGVADILAGIPEGKLLIAYSQGLHHIHAPGDPLPRLFRKARLRAETLDIPTYRAQMLARHGQDGFKRAVVEDLMRRRDECCPEDDCGPEEGC